jgi:hypothetical protein
VVEPVVGLARPLIPVSWHDLHSAFCLFWDKVIGPTVGHHFDLGLLILDCFLVKMSLVVASKRVHAQGAPAHLECHGEHAEPSESIRSQVMNLQVEALQNFAHKIFTGNRSLASKKSRKTTAS